VQLQKDLNVDLSGKTVILASDDYIPYPYIKNFIPYIKNSNIVILANPTKYYRYTNILLNSFGIKNAKFVDIKNIENYYNNIFILFFGKKENDDKDYLLKVARYLLINEQEVVALSEKGIDIDEDSPVYRS
jgi:hypothetical protein